MGIQLDNPALSDVQKSKLLDLIGRNRDVFATKISEVGKTNVHTHCIETRDAMPVRQRPYRASPKIEAEINKQIGEMSSSGIIEPSTSMWQSHVVMVKKKSNEMRFAIDYRNLNKVNKQISFPLPRLDNVFDKLGQANASWFSTLDLASRFYYHRDKMCNNPCQLFVMLILFQMNLLSNICLYHSNPQSVAISN